MAAPLPGRSCEGAFDACYEARTITFTSPQINVGGTGDDGDPDAMAERMQRMLDSGLADLLDKE